MQAAPSSPQAVAIPTKRRSTWDALRPVIGFSLAVTACAGLVAAGIALASDVRFLLAFVILRWCVVAALLATPLIQQVAGSRLDLPYVLRTPLTALALTCESIVVDIISAQTH